MGEPKPLASLTSGLLARKGAARPAMRRQPLGSGPAPTVGVNGYDDLGWNDMGYDVDPVRPDADTRVDLKPLMIESMPAHNFDAETAVDADVAGMELTPLPWANADVWGEPAEVPEVVRQFEVLQARVKAAAAEAEVVEAAAVEAAVFEAAVFEAAVVESVLVAARVVKPAVRRSPVKRAASDANQRDKAAFTLRLDAERHLRLRLASAIYNRSLQQILIEVLDNYLAALPEIDAMASRLPASPLQRKSAHSSSDGE